MASNTMPEAEVLSQSGNDHQVEKEASEPVSGECESTLSSSSNPPAKKAKVDTFLDEANMDEALDEITKDNSAEEIRRGSHVKSKKKNEI